MGVSGKGNGISLVLSRKLPYFGTRRSKVQILSPRPLLLEPKDQSINLGPVTGNSRNVAMALSERSELSEIEANILHGIVPPIASPQFQIMNRRCRRYQRISQFNAVALAELSQIFPGLPCNLQVD